MVGKTSFQTIISTTLLMGNIIDRRRNWKGKSTGNKSKFIKRVEAK
jgi:hypothetical protein